MRSNRAAGRLRLVMAAIAVATVSSLTAFAPQAEAAAPPERAEAFQAAKCAGETSQEPTTSGPAFQRDLTQVLGARLDAYNAGQIVPLYDNTGRTQSDAAPPMCTVRYDAAVGGPVSEWMLCTDFELASCNDLLSGGRLAHEGQAIGFPEPAESRFTEDQEFAIRALIFDGHTTQGPFGPLVGRTDGTHNERYNLQTMVWCVSDGGFNCAAANMDESDIAELAAEGRALAATATLTAAAAEVEVGDEARWVLRTNIIGTPLELTSDLPLAVCDDSTDAATIEGSTITVAGEAGTTAEVALCATTADAGEVEVSVARGGDGMQLAQPDIAGTTLPKECQVFALLGQDAVAASAVVDAVAPSASPSPTEGPSESPSASPSETPSETTDVESPEATDEAVADSDDSTVEATVEAAAETGDGVLPDTGNGATLWMALLGLALLGGGAGLLIAARRARA